MIRFLPDKIQVIVKLIFLASWSLRLPSKRDVLIYDSMGAEAIEGYLHKNSFDIFYINGERLNIPCLMQAALSIDFWRGNLLRAYSKYYIRAVRPKVVITFIDNAISFYEIKSFYKAGATIFIQNGVRAEFGDVFDKLTKPGAYHVDYMFVVNKSIAEHYRKYISGSTIAIGSFKNNFFNVVSSQSSDTVTFISAWRPKPNGTSPLYTESDGAEISWEEYMEAEVRVLNFLDKWCAQNNKTLEVCCRHIGLRKEQQNFFSGHLTNCHWKYTSRSDQYSSYKKINSAQIVVSIDSTLGYEAIGRGKKTAFFNCRTPIDRKDRVPFGWPAQLASHGPFWTNSQDESEFQRILDYLYQVSDAEWNKVCRDYAPLVMEFDSENTRFVALLDKLLTDKAEIENAN